MLKEVEKWYNLIRDERNRRLKLAEETSNEYQFNVAHGLTEALRLFDKSGLNTELDKFLEFCNKLEESSNESTKA